MESDFEDVINLVGGFGKFQLKLLLFIHIPCSFFVAFTVNLFYFQVIVPDHWCHIPDPDQLCHVPTINQSHVAITEWKDLAIPKNSDGSYEKCLQFVTTHEEDKNCSYFTNQTQECTQGWDHDQSLFWETVATDEEWLCEKGMYSVHILAINMAGNTVGSLFLPLIADRLTGRKIMFFITLAIYIIFSLSLLLVHDFFIRGVLRFFAGLVYPANFQMPYVVTLEFLTPEHRGLTVLLSFAAFIFGMCFTSLMAYTLPHWRYLVILSCIPYFAFFGVWRMFPESPRWLLSKGKLKECSEILLKVAKVNGKKEVTGPIIKGKLDKLLEKEGDSQVHLREILKYPRFCRNGIIVLLLGFLNWITYGCLLLNMSVLPNRYFLNFFILSLIELPSAAIGWLSMNYLGRRMTSLLTYSSAAVFSFIAVLNLENRVLLLCMVALTKLFATEGQYIVYSMAGEIFPTPIRSTGLGAVGVFTMFGMLLVPYIIEKGEVFQYSLAVVLHLICVVLGLLLPETLDLPLPQTLPDAEILGKDRPFFKWIHHWNSKKSIPCAVEETK